MNFFEIEQEDPIDYNKQNNDKQDDNQQNDTEQNDNQQDVQDLNIIMNETSSLLNTRITTTDSIRRVARAGQKRQADQFLQCTAKKTKLIPVPDIDRGPTDARNVLGVIMEIKHDQLKIGTEKSILFGYYSFHQVSKAPGMATLLIEDVPTNITKSLRAIVKLQSITGGQGFMKCDCKQGCRTNKCKCKQANILCNSRCHSSATCCNK
ncbi:unnamed protein product [Rotaria sp. Silwood2]|nr:unnamed protein product [Rotaria sp. Silwood2]